LGEKSRVIEVISGLFGHVFRSLERRKIYIKKWNNNFLPIHLKELLHGLVASLYWFVFKKRQNNRNSNELLSIPSSLGDFKP